MITLSAGHPYGLKQLAAVILKNFIKKHWQVPCAHPFIPSLSLSHTHPVSKSEPPQFGNSATKVALSTSVRARGVSSGAS
jgi:hypothetical protein